MKRILISVLFLFLLAASITACSSQRFKGSASDRTGTNGATNGTGKIYTGS